MLRFSWEPTYIITEMHILTSSGAFWRGMAASSFAAACVLTMGIDYLVGNVAPLSKMTTYGLHRSEPYLASESYRQLKAAPDVVLIGSSLMLAPVLQSEANRLGQPLDRKRYRKSVVLEELLAQSGLSTALRRAMFRTPMCRALNAPRRFVVWHSPMMRWRPAICHRLLAPAKHRFSNVWIWCSVGPAVSGGIALTSILMRSCASSV